MLKIGKSLVRSELVSLEFFRPHYGPEVDSVSNRNEYQEHFLGVEAAGAFCAVVMKSENLNFVEPSGPLQACNGIALPFCLKYLFTTFMFLLLRGYW